MSDICNENSNNIALEQRRVDHISIELREKLITESENNVNNKSLSNTELTPERDVWSNKIEYMLSVIGYVVDLGSKIIMVHQFYFIIFKTSLYQ